MTSPFELALAKLRADGHRVERDDRLPGLTWVDDRELTMAQVVYVATLPKAERDGRGLR